MLRPLSSARIHVVIWIVHVHHDARRSPPAPHSPSSYVAYATLNDMSQLAVRHRRVGAR
jgi:hypothetical protein